MNPEFLDSMSWEMAEVYGAITDQILVNLAKYFPYYNAGNVPKSAFTYQAQMLAQMGQVNRETVKIIRQGLKDANSALEGILEQAIIDSVKKAEKPLWQAVKNGIYMPPQTPVLSPNQYRAFQIYYKQASNKLNMVNTVMLESTQQAYRNTVADIAARVQVTQTALDIGAGETITGVSTWNQAVKHSIDRMKDNGITGFIDHAGHRWSAEAYTSMDIRTTVYNTSRAAVWETNQNFGNDLYLVSYHNGARPLCYPWQNKVISSTNNARVVTDLDGNEIQVYAQSDTSYGMPAGLFGINCKHYPTPFIPGISVIEGQPQSEEANAKSYAESQEQRRLERKLREEKRDLMMAKAQGAPEDEIKALRAKCRQTSDDIDTFCEETGRARRQNREAVYTQREFPDSTTYDPKTFVRDQKEQIDKYFNEGGAQKEFTAGTMTPKNVMPITPVVPPTPAPAPPNVPPAVQQTTPPVTQATQQATDDFVTKYLPSRNLKELPVTQFTTQPTETEIIERLAGADKTKGSCVSVAFAYTGNKGGYDVHDFRGGDSRLTFAINANITKIAKFQGVDAVIENTVNDYTGAHKVLKSVESGKEYFFRTGKHAAIVRQGASSLEYLELQSNNNKGWHRLDDIALDWRFGCQKSHTTFGMKYGLDNVLIDVDKLNKSPDFIEMLKYINTAVNEQQKGVGGGIK